MNAEATLHGLVGPITGPYLHVWAPLVAILVYVFYARVLRKRPWWITALWAWFALFLFPVFAALANDELVWPMALGTLWTYAIMTLLYTLPWCGVYELVAWLRGRKRARA